MSRFVSLFSSNLRQRKPIITRTEKFFYTNINPKLVSNTSNSNNLENEDENLPNIHNQLVVPLSFITCLNVMCFLSRRKRCMGKYFTKASKILKWLWAEEKLQEGFHNQTKLFNFLKDVRDSTF